MMLISSAHGASKISEFFRVFKLALALVGGLVTLGSALPCEAQTQPQTQSEPQAQPVRVYAGIRIPIADQVPLNPAERYLLEVAKDPGFSEVLLRAEVLGATLAWDAPSEGVYHWRLARLAKKNRGADVVTFVSGSVVAIDGSKKREKPARITWDPAPGADRYKLNAVDGSGKLNAVTTPKTEYVVPEVTASFALEVIPYTGTRRTFRDFHFNPTLKLDAGLPPPASPVVPTTVEVSKPMETKVEKTEVIETAVEEVKIRSRQMIHLYGLYVNEEVSLAKLEIGLDSAESLAGFGARLWSQPAPALVIKAEGSGFRHAADLTQPDVLPGQSVSLDLWRYTGHGFAGINVLSLMDVDDHVLVVAGGGALTRMPFLPTYYNLTGDRPLTIAADDIPLLGGGLLYAWFGDRLIVSLEGSRFMDQEGEGSLTEGRGLLQIRVTEGIFIDLGGYGRLTQLDRCASLASDCLREGTVASQTMERGGTLGLSAQL